MFDLLDEAVWALRECTPNEVLMGAFSGGKDSIALKKVCEIADVHPEWHYHNTTIDPPEVVYFIRKHHPDVIFDAPKHGNFFTRARKKGVLPSFRRRWCCSDYKEARGPLNCVWITGERREESPARKKQPLVGLHKNTRRVIIRPLANWDSEYLWAFIHKHNLPYPSLYDEGWTRVGCIGCPMASRKVKEKEFARWPRYAAKWEALAKHYYDKMAPWDSFATFDEFYNCWLDRKF